MLPVVGDSWNLLGSGDPSHNVWCAVESPVCVFRVLGEWDVAGKNVSVILMTYAERGSIRATIEGFFATGLVDEVLVVNNNAETGTSEEVAQTLAREVFESRQGYGWASRRGLAEATGDLLVLAEPDGTFCRATSASCWPTATSARQVFGTVPPAP